jgi:hypothetical protein
VREAWIRLSSEESGQALVLAIAIVILGLLLGLGAVAYGLNAGQASNHDEHARGSQQAADSGVQASVFQEAGTAAVGYNVTSGSLGNLLVCTVPEINATTGLQVGTTTVSVAAANGACPSAVTTSGATIQNPWFPLSNENYYESVFFPNVQTPSINSGLPTGYSPGGLSVEFPEIVSIGCNTTATTGAADCQGNASGAAKYSRDLAILDPTGPLQAIEAGNNAYLQGGLSLVNSVPVVQSLLSSLGLSGLLSGLSCNLLHLGCSTYPAMILDGNVAAGNDVQLPNILLGVNTDASITSLLGSLSNLNLGALGALVGTVDYGNQQAATVSPGPTVTQSGSYSASGTTLAEIANQVHTSSGLCTAGNPSNTCTLARPTFTIGSSQALTTSSQLTLPTGATLPSSGTSTGDLSMSTGTLTLAAGTYFFCNVNVTGGTVVGPSTGAAQIYVLQPGASQCSGDTGSQGNFTVTPGINAPTGLSATVNGVTSTVNPSTVQIYVAGNPNDALAVGTATAPSTSVSIGSGSAVTQAMVIYAPRSNVSVSTGAAFVGSAVGWNVTLNAVMVLQDLNLGNYPLSSVVNGVKIEQNVECSNAVTQLAAPTSTTAEATDTAGCT